MNINQNQNQHHHQIQQNSSEILNQVRNHYSNLPNNSISSRLKTKTIHLKKFNNWLKSVLIELYCSTGDFVLDICSGKGGDLAKWQKQKVGYVLFCDLSPNSVKQSLARYTELYNQNKQKNVPTFKANFVTADCFMKNLLQQQAVRQFIPFQFDFVSCQFALHYSWETESRARQLLHNVACNLRVGGHFVCTLPNAHWIMKKFATTVGNTFGNTLYQIRFEKQEKEKEENNNNNKKRRRLFGEKYFFSLQDAIDDCPEYLVHPQTFITLAAEYNLDLVQHEPFHQFYAKHVDRAQFHSLLTRMRADNISMEEWEAIGIYSVFAFRKKAAQKEEPPNRSNIVASINHTLPTENDIVVVD